MVGCCPRAGAEGHSQRERGGPAGERQQQKEVALGRGRLWGPRSVPGPCDTRLGTGPTSCGSSQSPAWGVFLSPELRLGLGAQMGLFPGPGACDTDILMAVEAPALLQRWPPPPGPRGEVTPGVVGWRANKHLALHPILAGLLGEPSQGPEPCQAGSPLSSLSEWLARRPQARLPLWVRPPV